jgi:hypothetical protein
MIPIYTVKFPQAHTDQTDAKKRKLTKFEVLIMNYLLVKLNDFRDI